ncbi:MAG: hypothetical protein LBS34_02920 [Rickettsiales bacterium]|jgi:diaminopimelate epimerase|nr:hypothetical protein [Rickettsiales bacterium]
MINGVLISPGGNNTAIVTTPIPRSEQKSISLLILEKYTDVEQVAFCEDEGNYLQMAGSEFCCNAARAFGFLKLKGNNGLTTFRMSGTDQTVSVRVKSSNSEVEIPVNMSLGEAMKSFSNGSFMVHLKGITHFVITETSDLFRKNAGKEYADKILQRFNLKDEIASSVSFLSNTNGIEPYVFVKNINTLYAETACGSGSLACAMVHSWQIKKSIQNLKIRQPSGADLVVSVSLLNDYFGHAFVGGTVKILNSELCIHNT